MRLPWSIALALAHVACGSDPGPQAPEAEQAVEEDPGQCDRLNAAVAALGALGSPRAELVTQPYQTDGVTPRPIYVLEVGELYVPVPADTYRVAFAPGHGTAPTLQLRSSRFLVEVQHRVPDSALPDAQATGDPSLFGVLDPRPSTWELLSLGYQHALSDFACDPTDPEPAARIALGLTEKLGDAPDLGEVVAHHGAGQRMGEGVTTSQTTLDDEPLLLVGREGRNHVWWLRLRDGAGITSVRWQAFRKDDRLLVARLPPLVGWTTPLVDEAVPPSIITDAAQAASGERQVMSGMLRHRRTDLSAASRKVLEDILAPAPTGETP